MSSIDIPAIPGIYKITCITTGKLYVGSATNLYARRNHHFYQLRHGTHGNPKLQRAWNKYGPDAFLFEILEFVLLPELLTAREQFWFTCLRPFGHRGFNIASVAGSSLGKKASPETRKRLSALNSRRKTSEETKRRLSEANTGKKCRPETKEKLHHAQLGRKQSEETKRKQAETRRGKTHSPETLKKMSIAQLGHPVREETREKLRLANIGKRRDSESHVGGMKTLIVIDPNGTEHHVCGIKRFCREHHLNYRTLTQVAQGKLEQHQGWRACYSKPDAS